MSPLLRFLAALVVGLALVAVVASFLVNDITRDWFERDMSLRARLAVSGARSALVMHWPHDPMSMHKVLTDLTRDERIMAAAACSNDATLLAATDEYPAQISCQELAASVHP